MILGSDIKWPDDSPEEEENDNTIRSIRIRTGNSVIERPIQLLYPIELHSDSKTTTNNTQDDNTLKVNVEEFCLKRLAAAVAKQRIRDIADNEHHWKIFDLHHQMGGRTMWKSYNLMNLFRRESIWH